MRILAADVGGTKTVLAVYQDDPDTGPRELRSQQFRSADFPDIAPMVRRFLEGDRPVDRAGIGVAGPVVNDTCRATNLPWELDARRIETDLGIPRVHLVNDFAAVALGIRSLAPDDLVVLQDGEVDPDGPVIAVGAGTGLGEAIVIPDPRGERIISSEGGHTDFAPRTEDEMALLRFLWKRHRGRVSVERVVSGRGLAALYDFVVEEGLAPTSEDVRRRVREEDPGHVIGTAALEGSDDACVKAVDMFVSAYGAEVGNFALTVLPTGGVYLAGGIAPRLVERFRGPTFLDAFLSKGRMSYLLERLRVMVIMNTRVGLLGALVAGKRD
ncbi:MAG: glucokinase [Myxococcota bacterium]